MIIRELFAIPIFQEKIDNYNLKDYVIDLSNNDTTVIKSNIGGWQSKQYYKPEKQFESWGVKYHDLKFGKPIYDLFVDDKNINSERFFTQETQ